MAPESERATTCTNCGRPIIWHAAEMWVHETGYPRCDLYALPATKPAAPALTCSEVVERLAKIADDYCHGRAIAEAIRTQAPSILHSWRERRVQELEEAPEMYDGFWYFECGCGTETLDANHLSCLFHNKPIRQHEFKGIGKSQEVKHDKK